MNQHKNMHLFSYRSGKIASLLLATGVIFCALFGLITTKSGAKAQGVPGGNIKNTVISAVDIAEPAVVRIITSVPARLTVQFTANDSIVFPRNGGSYSLDLSGSGAFISSHGDIVTADHVVRPPQADMTDYLYQLAAQDITNYVNNTYATTPPYDVNQIYNALATGTFRSEPQYDKPKSQVYLSTAYTGQESAKTFKNIAESNYAPIDTIKKESSPDIQDLAIIHVGMENTPSIPLGDSTSIAQQDELTVIGFPGNADITQREDPTQLLTSSINKIYVSAIKQSDDGTSLLEVAGNIEHGDSGGPALDSQGHLVGVVSFQKDSNGQPNNTSFLHVSQNIQQMITDLKLDTTPGTFQKGWQQGFKDYASNRAGHWHKANQEFTKLAANYPTFHALEPFISYTSLQAEHESLPQTSASNTTPRYLPYLLAALVVVLLLILGATIFIMNRKSRPSGLSLIEANTALVKRATTLSSSSRRADWPPLPATPLPATTAAWNSAAAPMYDSQAPSPTAIALSRHTPTLPVEAISSSTGEIRRATMNSKQPVLSIREHANSWSKNADATIPNPPPLPSTTPHYQNSPSYYEDEDVTGKHSAIQIQRAIKRASEGEKTIVKQAPEQPKQKENGQPPFEQGKTTVNAYSWPAPTTWQQAGMLNSDFKRGNSVKMRQIDFSSYKDDKQQ